MTHGVHMSHSAGKHTYTELPNHQAASNNPQTNTKLAFGAENFAVAAKLICSDTLQSACKYYNIMYPMVFKATTGGL